MNDRIKQVEDTHHIAIDGTLKINNSVVNMFSERSRKSKKVGTINISVLFAYDVETKLPVGSKVYPENVIDETSYNNFLTPHNFTKGVIMADKGFPKSKANEFYKENPHVSWLSRSSRIH